jgi:hypothetical protein
MAFLLSQEKLGITYQIADDDFAIAAGKSSFGGCGLCGSATSRSRSRLLNTTGRSGRSRAAVSCASQRAATNRVAALGGDDLVKRLVELGRHDDGFGGW